MLPGNLLPVLRLRQVESWNPCRPEGGMGAADQCHGELENRNLCLLQALPPIHQRIYRIQQPDNPNTPYFYAGVVSALTARCLIV